MEYKCVDHLGVMARHVRNLHVPDFQVVRLLQLLCDLLDAKRVRRLDPSRRDVCSAQGLFRLV